MNLSRIDIYFGNCIFVDEARSPDGLRESISRFKIGMYLRRASS